MKLPMGWTTGSLTFSVAVVAAGVAIASCKLDKIQVPADDDGGTTAGACPSPVTPGTYPPADCATDDNPTPTCHTNGMCMINEAVCGSKSTCLPMSSNKGKDVLDFRIRRLTVLSPSALAGATVQNTVVDHGINLDAKQCGEKGDGSFTWLLRVDKTKSTLTTGGSPPTTDPYGTGFCFADLITPGTGQHVAPITGKITFTGDTFSSDAVDKLVVPIFVMNKVDQLLLLPLSNVAVKDVTISSDGDCIGAFNYSALDDVCYDTRSDCSRWHTAGALGGYITLEEADQVNVSLLNKTLCAILTGAAESGDAGQPAHCYRNTDGTVRDKGDYCSKTKSAGGCQDSYWLAATFAASAVKIKPASSDPLCSGGGTGDGGADAASD